MVKKKDKTHAQLEDSFSFVYLTPGIFISKYWSKKGVPFEHIYNKYWIMKKIHPTNIQLEELTITAFKNTLHCTGAFYFMQFYAKSDASKQVSPQ